MYNEYIYIYIYINTFYEMRINILLCPSETYVIAHTNSCIYLKYKCRFYIQLT